LKYTQHKKKEMSSAYTEVDLVKLGVSLLDQHDIDGALNAFNNAIKINPSYCMAYFNKGIAYFRLKEYSKAIEYVNKAIQLNPVLDADYHATKGFILMKIRNFTEAIQCFQQAILIDPIHFDSYLNKGICFNHLKQYFDAISSLNRASIIF
jgi:tetratricopeptide (TPR) repeat protein